MLHLVLLQKLIIALVLSTFKYFLSIFQLLHPDTNKQ